MEAFGCALSALRSCCKPRMGFLWRTAFGTVGLSLPRKPILSYLLKLSIWFGVTFFLLPLLELDGSLLPPLPPSLAAPRSFELD